MKKQKKNFPGISVIKRGKGKTTPGEKNSENTC